MTRAARSSASPELVLDAAADIFSMNGYAGTTLDAVAQRLGISRQGVLYYYPGKEALFSAVLERDREWAARAAIDATPDDTSVLTSLSTFLGLDDDGVRRLRLQHVLQGEAIAGNEVARDFVQERDHVIREQIELRVTDLAARDRLADGWDIPTATTAIHALIKGLQSITLTGGAGDTAAAFATTISCITTKEHHAH